MNLMHSITTTTHTWAAGLKAVTSKCCNCERSMTLTKHSSRKAGIKMQNRWYCSSQCLIAAAELELSRILPSRLEPAHEFTRMPLGLNLIRRGLLSRSQYEEAMEQQRVSGGEIGELIVRDGLVSERQLAEAVAAQWACPVFAISRHFVRDRVQIPLTLIEANSAIPLDYVAATNHLLVGFVHRIRYGLLSAIEDITGCKTRPCFVTLSDFQAEKSYLERARDERGDATPIELRLESPQGPPEMAKILTDYCVDLEAEEMTIRRCNEYIWARLGSDSKKADLLFKTE